MGSERKTLLKRLMVPETCYQIVLGWFQDTLPVTETGPVTLLHLDCDFFHDSVKLVLEIFYGRLADRGYVVLNAYSSFTECRRATDDFLKGLDAGIQLNYIDHDVFYFREIERKS